MRLKLSSYSLGKTQDFSQYVLPDPYVSKRHLRVYTVVYANDEPNEIDVLVYAEDLSHNGTFWNGSLIGKGNGGFLLCHGDILRLSRNTNLSFVALTESPRASPFDLTQEREMAVGTHLSLYEATADRDLAISRKIRRHGQTTRSGSIRQGFHGY